MQGVNEEYVGNHEDVTEANGTQRHRVKHSEESHKHLLLFGLKLVLALPYLCPQVKK